ncbi:hypothetical protein, partial [Xanthobacter agilis]|uniref:hypothetical protein n=1 Tax=Xanthobacter agilis TaxID=47492 RepID=UPI001F43732E
PLPLIIPKSIAIHRRSSKISVESDLRPLGNPKSLNRHYGLEQTMNIHGEDKEATRQPLWRWHSLRLSGW